MAETSLYKKLKQSNLIQEQTSRMEPCRMRAKAMGYMWEGEINVITTEGLKLVFYFWHHFHYDDGDNWSPSQEELDAAWRLKFVPEKRSATSKLCDASWHSFWVNNHLYVSQQGTFDGKRTREEIIAKIKDGSWGMDTDLWMLI